MDVIEKIARVCHEANRAWCEVNGDTSQHPWMHTRPEIRASAIAGVNHILANPNATPEESHAEWMRYKLAEGWTVGPVKDVAEKVHPNLVPYDQLPPAERAKDRIFRAVILAVTAE